jgi:pilus assembly protein FimV
MSDSQKFIARNRAPRVQIEYDVELYGAQKKVQLPFVMGVFSDLSGKAETPPIADRKFLEIDVDNFNERMASIAPKAQFSVPNTLTGEGNLAVDLTFTKMDDFSPEAIAENVDSLRPLLEARRQLSDLMTYMDGKAGAETLIEKLLTEPALLAALGGGSEASGDVNAALDSLRAALPAETPKEGNGVDDTLAALAANAPADAAPDTSVDDALGTLQPPPEVEEKDEQAAALDALRTAPAPETAETDSADDVLSGIARTEDTEAVDGDETADVLASLERVEDAFLEDDSADVLASLERVEDAAPEDESVDVLAGIDRVKDAPEEDTAADVLSNLERVEDAAPEDDSGDVLAGIDRVKDATDEDATDNVLKGIAPVEETEEADATPDILADLADTAVDAADDTDEAAEVLAGLDRVETEEAQDDTDDVLAGLEAPPEQSESASADDVLAGLDAPEPEAETGDNLDDILGDIAATPTDDAAEDNSADDILAGLDAPEPEADEADNLEDILGSIDSVEETDESDPIDDVLGEIAAAPVAGAPEVDSADDILAGLETSEPEAADSDDLDDILGGLDVVDTGEDDTSIADVLGDIDAPPTEDTPESESADDVLAALDTAEPEPEADDLDDILGELDTRATEDESDDDLDDILSGLDDVEEAAPDTGAEDVLAGLDAPEPETGADDLDDILGDLEAAEAADDADIDLDDLLGETDDTTDEGDTDLDDLLGELDAPAEAEAAAEPDAMDDLDALLGDLDAPAEATTEDANDSPDGGDAEEAELDDLDALLGGLDDTDDAADITDEAEPAGENVAEAEASQATDAPRQSPFGVISAPRPERGGLNRNKFRMAVFGDFTGRSARGMMETGDALAARRPIPLDVDTIDDIIEGFGTTLTLKIGKGGGGVDIKLKELDDLHPDELYDNIEVFEEISGLRQQLGMGSMAERTSATLKEWSETYSTPIKLPTRSASTSVPANLKLSDFQALIGDRGGKLTQNGPADDFIAQIVGPHIVKAPDAGVAEMTAAVDEALSAAMRLVLHHPNFQAIESQWRSLDMLARRIETDSELEIILYDVSAEELAADLAAQEDLAESGLFKLVTDVIDPEEGTGGFSALFGLYTFEETPTHAELLARIGQVGAHVDAPFFSAISPGYLDVAKEDRHPLVAKAWDTLRGLPEAAYLALSSPRFLLRLPYGAKSEPIYAFQFEEFTPHEGLKGMLWANPVVLVAILLAGTYKKDGKAMDLGTLMSLGDLPFHYVTDRHGDQVALPCTERNLTSDAAQTTLGRGYMPVVWVKGRNEIRLGSFRSLAGDMIAGPWEAEVPAPRPKPGSGPATLEMDITGPEGEDGSGDTSLDDLLGDLDDGADASADDDLDASLDDLLAGFDDDTGGDDDGSDDMDPELAALLEGL